MPRTGHRLPPSGATLVSILPTAMDLHRSAVMHA